MKVHKIEPIYLNDYYTAKPSKRQERRARLQESKTLRALDSTLQDSVGSVCRVDFKA
jgi:hypothetical protein